MLGGEICKQKFLKQKLVLWNTKTVWQLAPVSSTHSLNQLVVYLDAGEGHWHESKLHDSFLLRDNGVISVTH